MTTSNYHKVINTLSFILCIAVNAYGGSKIGDISRKYTSLITPAGAAFSIWGVIYLGLFCFVIYQGLPKKWTHSVGIDHIGVYFALSCCFNAGWIISFTRETALAVWISSALLFGLLTSLCVLYENSGMWRNERHSYVEIICLDIVFSIYTGWVTVASILNVTLGFVASGTFKGVAHQDYVAVIILLVALLLFVFVSYTRGDPVFPLVLSWACFWIARNIQKDVLRSDLLLYSACGICLISLVTSLTIFLFFRKRKTSLSSADFSIHSASLPIPLV